MAHQRPGEEASPGSGLVFGFQKTQIPKTRPTLCMKIKASPRDYKAKEKHCYCSLVRAAFEEAVIQNSPLETLPVCACIDLNPVAAGIAAVPETSKYTSVPLDDRRQRQAKTASACRTDARKDSLLLCRKLTMLAVRTRARSCDLD